MEQAADNIRTEAEAKAFGTRQLMEALASADPKTVQALASTGMDPSQLIAQAFQGLADSAEKVGQLNISPDLLNELMNAGNKRQVAGTRRLRSRKS